MEKMIPIETVFEKWRKKKGYTKAYDALEEEFALAHALIQARAKADLTQADVAERMKTTQSAVARLESGSSNPSIALLRKYAAATGSDLKIELLPSS